MDKPVYVQVKEQLLEDISHMPPDTMIDSERDLAKKFHAARMTVRKAVELLVEDGYLYRRKNAGTFTASAQMRKPKPQGMDVLYQNESDYVQHKVLYFNVMHPDIDLEKRLSIAEEDFVIRILRSNIKDEIVCSIDEIYLVQKYYKTELSLPKINDFLDHELTQNAHTILQRFLPVLIPVAYANVLKLSFDTPVLMIESTLTDIEEKPLYFIRTYNHPKERIAEITIRT